MFPLNLDVRKETCLDHRGLGAAYPNRYTDPFIGFVSHSFPLAYLRIQAQWHKLAQSDCVRGEPTAAGRCVHAEVEAKERRCESQNGWDQKDEMIYVTARPLHIHDKAGVVGRYT